MKRICSILLVLALAFAAVSCGSSAQSTSAAAGAGADDTPPWLNDFPPEDALWGIGIAKQSSQAMSMTTAEARARVAIARQLDNKVQAMFTDYNLDAGNVGAQANSSMQEDVSRQVTNINLSGAVPKQKWKAQDGTWWFLVEYKKSDAKNAVANILNNEQAAFAQFKAKQALDMMDAQLAKNDTPVRVDSDR